MDIEKIVPKELHSFISEEGGNSLIIKGETGTGKTTLALQIMEEYYGLARSDYISKRVEDKKLFKQFPWLKEKIKQQDILGNARKLLKSFYSDDIINTVSMDEVQKTQTYLSRRFLKSIHEKEEGFSFQKEELQKLEGKVERGEIIGEDEEMSDSFKNEFVFEIGKTLPEIDKAYEMVKRSLPKESLIIIDSIEALSDHYGIPKEKIVSALQKDLSDNGNTNLIFITESTDTNKIDYIADGIIKLEKRYHDNKVIREMNIEKLKSKQVKNSKYIFSLHEGNFKFIKSHIPNDFTKMKKEPILMDKADKISTGHENIDEVIDGLEYPGSHIIEIDENIPKEALENIMSALLSNSCILNRGTITLPPFGYNASQIKSILNGYVPEEKIKHLLIMQQFLPEPDENSIELRGEDLYSDFDLNRIGNQLSESKSPYTFLVGLNSLIGNYGDRSLAKLNNIIPSIVSKGHSFVGFCIDEDEKISNLKVAADDVLKIEMINGIICFYTEKSHSPLYSLSFKISEGNPTAEVIPIV